MTFTEWAILMYVIGVALVVAELLLPTHGVLGAAGAGAVLVSIIFWFLVQAWLGVGVLAVSMAATPFVWMGAMKIFPKTAVGRVLVLPPVENPAPPVPVQMGQVGVTVSELRPMGICEFGDHRVEAISEQGVIPAGRKVQVVDLTNRRPTVRVV